MRSASTMRETTATYEWIMHLRLERPHQHVEYGNKDAARDDDPRLGRRMIEGGTAGPRCSTSRRQILFVRYHLEQAAL